MFEAQTALVLCRLRATIYCQAGHLRRDWKVSVCIFLQNWKVSELESVRIGKCQNWKVSELESVRIGKCQNRKVSELFGV